MYCSRSFKTLRTILYFTVCILLIAAAGGCSFGDGPRPRLGSFFDWPASMMFPDPEKLGQHKRKYSMSEKVGLVYTCRAGFIDLGHLREAADRTAYLSSVARKNISEKNSEFSYKVIEPSKYWVKLKYPSYWEQLSEDEKEKITTLASIHLGRYFAHRSMVWHEIVTWYGFSSVGIFPENISSFSWEDTYSDNLGTMLATKALLQGDEDFDKTMTELIDQTLGELGVQPSAVARQAVEKIKGEWYTGAMYFFVTMKKQNFDVGFDDGMITPFLVPDICQQTSPAAFPVPDLQALNDMGFEIDLEIEPLVMEKTKINRAINADKDSRLRPDEHFPQIIEQIRASMESMALLYGFKY